MKIAVWYNLPSGGAKRALHDHLKGLVERGHTVEVWRPPIAQADYLPISERAPEHVVPLGIPCGIPKGIVQKIERRILVRQAMREHSKAVARQIADGGFDVLFANTCEIYHSPWIGRYLQMPKLLYLQEPQRFLYEAQPRLPWVALPEGERRSWKPRAIAKRALDALNARAVRLQGADELQNAQSFERILVNSNFSRESTLRAYGLDSEVCYLGIDASRFANLGLPREPFAISVGAFHPSKNPEFVIRAIGSIREGRPRLVWVANNAEPGYVERMRALAQGLQVELDLRQYIPDAELIDLLNRASVLAYAPRLEPFGYAPLEANACGCPAVVVAEGGVKESVREGINGVVVPHRPEAMGTAVADLLAHPDTTRAMGERAAAHVREAWTLERATEELERHLREVVGK